MLIWYPKVNYGPSVFIRTGASLDTGLKLDWSTDSSGWKVANFQDYTPHFT